MIQIPYGDWITAGMTVTYLQFLTWKKWYAWPLGMLTQVIWIYLTLSKELYGLTALSCVILIRVVEMESRCCYRFNGLSSLWTRPASW